VNNCTFYGNLGQDPEKKEGKKGDFILFSVAVRQFGNDEPLWVRCACFQEGLVDVIDKYLRKGSAVVVSGEISLFEGDKTSSIQLNVRNLSLAGKKEDDDRKSSKSSSRSRDDDDRPAKRRRDDDDDDRRERRTKSRDDDDDRKSSKRSRRDDDLDDEIPF